MIRHANKRVPSRGTGSCVKVCLHLTSNCNAAAVMPIKLHCVNSTIDTDTSESSITIGIMLNPDVVTVRVKRPLLNTEQSIKCFYSPCRSRVAKGMSLSPMMVQQFLKRCRFCTRQLKW